MSDHSDAMSTTRQFAPLAIILGIPLIFAALFFYTSPVVLETGGAQGIFKCGSPGSPNTEAKNVCSDPETVARNKAIYSGLSGVALVGLGAVWMLRGQRDDDEWDEDEPGTRRRGDDIDLRAGSRRRDREERDREVDLRERDRDDSRRGVGREPEDDLRGVERERLRGFEDDLEVDESRGSRRRAEGRRGMLRDDDFADPAPRRRMDDDWSSDGWR